MVSYQVYNEMLAILDHLVEEEMSDVKDKENTTGLNKDCGGFLVFLKFFFVSFV